MMPFGCGHHQTVRLAASKQPFKTTHEQHFLYPWLGLKMKIVLGLLIFFMSSSCFAKCDAEAKIAIKFMNAYIQYGQHRIENKSKQSTESWLRHTPLASHKFVSAYIAKDKEGRARDPDLGWGMDLILDAQDSPDSGFEFFKCSATPGYVQIQGIDWPEFKVTVRVERDSQKLLVTGAGVANVPPRERASR